MEESTLRMLMHFRNQFSGRAAVDSRLIQPGDIFFALIGQKVDGHQFLGEVALKGAKAAVVNMAYNGDDHGLVLIRVKDPLDTLQEMATLILSERNVKRVVVTGSVGKTTTKEFIGTLLEQKYRVGISPGNSNSQIGVPLTILNHTTGKEDVLVLEMAMTHSGQISKLIQIAPPDIAVITKVAPVHFCNFSSLADIARAKGEILAHTRLSLGIISRDIEAYEEICKIGTCPKLSFSITGPADYHLDEKENDLHVTTPTDQIFLPRPPIVGKHNLHNFIAALAVARALKLSWEDIVTALPRLKLPERRFQQIIKQGVLFINDSYNASAHSIKAALENLPKPKPGSKTIAVIGEMHELGILSEVSHREIGELALSYVDTIICVGKGCQPILECWQQAKRPVCLLTTLDEVLIELRHQMQSGDTVLLKGANSLGLWRLLDSFY